MAVLDIRDRDDVVVVYFSQARILDEVVIREIGEEFRDLTLQASTDRKLLVNFGRVEFMSSSMIGQIMRLHKMCQQDKVKLKLCNISPKILEVFKIMRLDKILDIRDDEDAAMEAFGGAKRSWFGRS